VHRPDILSSTQYFPSHLSYINSALIRPIVAFINRNRTLIPIHCHIDLGLSEFNGSWTTYDVGILDRMSEQVRLLHLPRALPPSHLLILELERFTDSPPSLPPPLLLLLLLQVYAALAHHVAQSNEQRLQTVGLWTLQMTANSLLGTLKSNFTLAPY